MTSIGTVMLYDHAIRALFGPGQVKSIVLNVTTWNVIIVDIDGSRHWGMVRQWNPMIPVMERAWVSVAVVGEVVLIEMQRLRCMHGCK